MVEITTNKENDIQIIHVNGEIDAGSSIHLDNAFNEARENGMKKVAVDLSQLHYISSAGLGVFVSHLDEFELEQVKLVIYGIQEKVRQVFDILGLEKVIQIKPSKEEGIKVLNE